MQLTDWTPQVAEGDQPLYHRIGEAVSRAIAAGELAAGTRLPPHRQLAWRLGVSVGSVSRAYDELTRQGLIEGSVGRGSFVAGSNARPTDPIDLSRNIPPTGPARAALRETMASLRKRPSWVDGMDYGPPAGSDRDRSAARSWLKDMARLELPDSSHIICTNGAHTALWVALSMVAKPGERILCEAATYSGLVALAAQFGLELWPVDLDREGLAPEALDRAAHESGSRILVTVPTLQNPTGRIMSSARRTEVLHIAKRHKLWVIEDDIYGAFANDVSPVPLATMEPERTLYVSSLSKTLAPGLRTGFLAVPASLQNQLGAALAAIAPTQAGLGQAIATFWIETGEAATVFERVAAEIRARTALLLRLLGHRVEAAGCAAQLHFWLPQNPGDAANLIPASVHSAVVLNRIDQFAVNKLAGPLGIRLCLGGARNQAELVRAASLLAGINAGSSAYADVGSF